MASRKVGLFLSAFVHAVLLLSSPVQCDDEEDNLLQGINSYRTAMKLSPLSMNKKAGCLADEVAEKLEDRPCSATNAGTIFQLDNYPETLDKCGIDPNNTRDGAIMPVCVPKLVPTLVLTNYTHTQFVRYLNDSKFTGAGVGSEDDWMVVVLTTNTPGGSFAGVSRLASRISFAHCLVGLLVGVLVFIV